MAKRNPWLRPAGADGLIPVVVLWNHFASLYGNAWRELFAEEAAKVACTKKPPSSSTGVASAGTWSRPRWRHCATKSARVRSLWA